MEKVLLFTHESDIDGIGCLVLAKLAFTEVDYVLEHNPQALEPVVREYFTLNKLDNYEKIYITDLALEEPALTMIAESEISKKIQVLDHHERAIKMNLNRYSFTTIIEEDTKKRCATELFYEYLVNNKYLERTNSLDLFVEMTRLEDTWTWKEYNDFGIKSHDLAILFNIIGKEKYLEVMTNKLMNNKESFDYSKEELELINNKKQEYEKELKKIISNGEYLIDELGNKFIIVFSKYEYRNEIGEYLRLNNSENVKYVIIAAMDKGEFGQKSYRAVEEGFDVNKVAMIHGGGGHIGAAAVNITKEQKEKVVNMNTKEALEFLSYSKYE